MAQYDFDYDGELRLNLLFSPFHMLNLRIEFFIEFNQSIWSGRNETRKVKWKTIIAQWILQSHSQFTIQSTKVLEDRKLAFVRSVCSLVIYRFNLQFKHQVPHNLRYQFPMFHKWKWIEYLLSQLLIFIIDTMIIRFYLIEVLNGCL